MLERSRIVLMPRLDSNAMLSEERVSRWDKASPRPLLGLGGSQYLDNDDDNDDRNDGDDDSDDSDDDAEVECCDDDGDDDCDGDSDYDDSDDCYTSNLCLINLHYGNCMMYRANTSLFTINTNYNINHHYQSSP